MTEDNKNLFFLALAVIFSTLFFWLIFAANLPSKIGFPDVSMETIYSNYDGPNYLIVTKCFYNTDCIRHQYSLPQPLEYYPAHLPGYPLIIKFFDFFASTPIAMLLATFSGSLFLYFYFYKLLRLYFDPKVSLFTSIIFLFFPARFLTLRLVGAPETWFIGSIIASIYYYKNKNILLAAIFAALAQSLKTPAVLLLLAYFILSLRQYFITKKISSFLHYWPFILVPIVIVLIFSFYFYQTGDFWAYFHSGDNFHLNPLPYMVFISSKSWINTIWLEEIIYILFISLISLQTLVRRYKWDIVSVFFSIFLLATTLVAHRDISRYASPLYPFALLSFAPYLNQKHLKIAFFLLLPAIALYAVNFIAGNIAPVADWTPYL